MKCRDVDVSGLGLFCVGSMLDVVLLHPLSLRDGFDVLDPLCVMLLFYLIPSV
jgi:hypothetical protein